MMIPRNFIIFGMFLMCVITVTRAGLVNDTCHKVWIREDITKNAAKLICNDTATVYDPKSQNGTYLMKDSGNWEGEIFACLCSCQLPFDLKNGQILSKNRICHGETLNYSCDDGYKTNIEDNITCYDGLLMTVPDNLETQNINIFSRQKSLSDSFANKSDGKVFDLWVNESANWSIPDTELQKNQKVFQTLSKHETVLQYYMCRGKDCMLGCVSLSMGGHNCFSLGIRVLECKKKISETTTIVSSTQDWLSWFIPVIVVTCILVIIIFSIVAICRRYKKKGKETTDIDQHTEGLPLQEQASQEQSESV
ncbi:hypothetical protein CHS0354_008366 [Potamilus streckersoni]|uniref:Sushi domain-containing protein n=1 Tax=Potamilus streckersoni TaxID=2493646 RepID=A0AAE0VGN8_9BIVA|nr:hypothetical protein CHS0354_008366 [Potamilus streckersoni]